MANPKRVIRKIKRGEVLDFDAQLWPILATLLVLTSFVIGVILIKTLVGPLSFSGPIFHNTWAWLICIFGWSAFSVFAAIKYSGMNARRRHLIFLLAILVHIGLGVGADSIRIMLPKLIEGESPIVAAIQEIITLPDYFHQETKTEREEQEHEKPVATESPEVQEQEIVKQETQREQEKTTEKPVDLEKPKKKVEKVKPIKLKNKQETRPKASETLAKLSRQQRKIKPTPTKAVEVPKDPAVTKKVTTKIEAKTAPTDRQKPTEKTIARPTDQSQPTTIQRQSEVKLVRKQSQQQPKADLSATAPLMKKASATPTDLPNTAAKVPEAVAAANKAPAAETEPTADPTVRKTSSPTVAKAPPTSQPKLVEPTPQQTESKLTRKQPAQQHPKASLSATKPLMKKASATPTATSVAAAQVPKAVAAAKKSPTAQTQPAAQTAVRKTSRSTVSSARPTSQPKLTPTRTISKSAPTRQQNIEARPVLVRTPKASPSKSRRAIDAPSVANLSAPNPSTSKQPTSAPTLRPSQSQPSQRAASKPNTTPARTTPSDAPTLSAATIIARSPTKRSERSSNVPTVNVAAPPASAIARSQRTANAATSPLQAAATPSVETTNRAAIEVQPNRLVVSRSVHGTAGVGASQNMQRSLPAADSPAPRASTAAMRRSSSQSGTTGPALNPSQPATIAKSRAGAEAPSATHAVSEFAPSPNVAGSHRPSEIHATASAATQRSNSSVSPSKVTAAKGSGDVDTGPTRTIAKAANSRGSGGGQPIITPGSPTEMISRNKISGAPPTAVDTKAVANVAATTAAGVGGGTSASPQQPNASATEVGRSQSGAVSVTPSAPSEESGPESPTGGAGQVATAAVGRATNVDSLPGMKAGGGTATPTRATSEAFAASTKADAPATTSATSASPQQPNATATDVGRSQSESVSVAANAPSEETGPESPTGAAGQVARAAIGRAANTDALPGMKAADATAAPTRASRKSFAASTKADAPTTASAGVAASANSQQTDATATDVGRSQSKSASVAVAAPSDDAAPDSATGGAGDVARAAVGRATGADALPGMKTGTATATPAWATRGAFAASTKADTPTLVGNLAAKPGPASGNPAAAGPSSTAAGDLRRASGVPGGGAVRLVGAMAGETPTSAPALGSVGKGITKRSTAVGGSEQAPKLVTGLGGAPLRRASRGSLPSTQAQPIDVPDLAAGGPVADRPASLNPADGLAAGAVTRQTSGGVQVLVNAEISEGGLGIESAPQPGSLNIRASRNSEVVTATMARFQNEKAGAEYAPDLRARYSAPELAGRKRGDRPGADKLRGKPATKTEEAIEYGLEFLARIQLPDGSWSFTNFKQGYEGAGRGSINSDTAATGLVLMAFLGAGYDHFDARYETVVRKGLDYLLTNQKESGELYVARDKFANETTRFYSHGIASIALCEAYGLTSDTKLRQPAQRALDFLIREQAKPRGGWRYSRISDRKEKYPKENDKQRDARAEADISVTGWAMMALKSGKISQLKVPDEAFERIEVFLGKAQVSPQDGSQYIYNPFSLERRKTNPTVTSVGLLMRRYLGWNRKNKDLVRGADYLMANLPAVGTPDNPKRDTYYWYYATQVMRHMEGEHWRAWKERLMPMLRESQITEGKFAGSWSPTSPVPDKWARHGGRIYVTAMNLLSLEVDYRLIKIHDVEE